MMKLSDREWKSFKISDFFNCYTGKYYNKNKYTSGTMPLVTAKSQYNGISDWIDIKHEEYFENAITIGKVDATSFYQPFKFVCSSDVTVIKPTKVKLNKYIAIFLCNQIMMQSSKFDYGNQIRLNDTKALNIMLPSINNQPDFQFMQDFIKEKYFILKSQIKEKQKHEVTDWRELDDVKWLPFSTSEVFNTIQRGKRLTKSNQIKGLTPYISSSGINNGLDNFISNNEKIRVFDNCLTIANSGSVGSTFYHTYRFIASDHVTHLKNNNLNKFSYLFIATMLRRLEGKYSFNREINDFRIKRERILLPTKNNQPDYEFMEQYMKRKEIEIVDRL
ncbi:restriction endonuclease subunit S [Staphylococcus argenteus]|uniref:restriction endonuclease subunit S n=2 Tax=Staphylococcus argenteus TaxID=985002 RepID=UPI000916FC42|nr:restriction endonuclease subunit S [Staphylococcus argenteus]MCG9853487.1 restriction endonuclease subunit S [Staphylococcus argenteus]MDR7648929.1 restriction endonuclease subunit S [Staphylococcus argenteus]MDR7681631.1 restriction endonuclease subunit S [Staphylococcus argenteus]SGW49186.1 BcgI-like restriction enzyme subunit beta [Staphylococcus argenteus]SGX23494.1 BcgI-like restriction enzyme subunit beta [Staphylococcus argenteus]